MLIKSETSTLIPTHMCICIFIVIIILCHLKKKSQGNLSLASVTANMPLDYIVLF